MVCYKYLFCFTVHRLYRTPEMWMDGTFQTAPSLFMQIYTIHAKVDGQFFPLAIALLPDKQEVTYRRMMVSIQQKSIDK